MTTRSLVLLSGGIDSTVLLADTITGGHATGAVFIDYGQRHLDAEAAAAAEIAARYGQVLHVVDMHRTPAGIGSALLGTGGRLPVDAPADDPTQTATVVPGRNLLMISAAAMLAQAYRFDRVRIACHAGDHDIYPDTRPGFISAAAAAVRASTEGTVTVSAPFATWKRRSVLGLGQQLDVPFRLTWSCYNGGTTHCGRCGACWARRDAFTQAGLLDPTRYAQ